MLASQVHDYCCGSHFFSFIKIMSTSVYKGNLVKLAKKKLKLSKHSSSTRIYSTNTEL